MSDDAGLYLLHPVGLNGAGFAGLGLENAHAPDLLGHGGRPRSIGMTLPDVADDLAASTTGRLDLAGFSFGAMVALEVALRHPDRVRSLFVACAPASVDRDVVLARAEAAEGGMAGVLDSTLQRWFTATALATPGHPGVAYARSTLLGLDPDAFADGWRAIAGLDVTDRLATLDLPVTCLAGEQDVSAPPEEVRKIANGISGARFVLVEGPHMAFLEQPALVADAIREHLAQVG